MGGTSQDVKRPKKMGFLLWVFLTVSIFYVMNITVCFKHLEASHIIIADTKAQFSDFNLGQKQLPVSEI